MFIGISVLAFAGVLVLRFINEPAFLLFLFACLMISLTVMFFRRQKRKKKYEQQSRQKINKAIQKLGSGNREIKRPKGDSYKPASGWGRRWVNYSYQIPPPKASRLSISSRELPNIPRPTEKK